MWLALLQHNQPSSEGVLSTLEQHFSSVIESVNRHVLVVYISRSQLTHIKEPLFQLHTHYVSPACMYYRSAISHEAYSTFSIKLVTQLRTISGLHCQNLEPNHLPGVLMQLGQFFGKRWMEISAFHIPGSEHVTFY